MKHKEKIKFILKLILELAVLVLLILIIMYLLKADDGIIKNANKGTSSEKLDQAIKIFSSTEGMKLEDALKDIEGIGNIDIDENTGTYNVTIDGESFVVVSKEVLHPEEEINVEE